MNTLRRILYIILLFPFWAQGKTTATYHVNGVNGPVLANVDQRLIELGQIKPLRDIKPDDLRLQVVKALQPFGYFRPQIDILTSTQDLLIQIDPGPQLHISALHTDLIGEGQANPQLRTIMDTLPFKIGGPFSSDDYEKSKQKLANTAENLGYLRGAFKKAEILIDEQKNTAEISLVYDTGPLYYFGQVHFDPTYISPELLHRFVPFRFGQPYTSDKLLQFNNALSSSGYFNSVLVKPKIGDAHIVPIKVRLQPVAKYSYSFGAGYGTDTGIRGRAALHVIPVNRYGHKFNAVAQGSFTQNIVQAQYVVPGRNPVTDQYSVTANYSNLNYDSGYSNALLVSAAQQHNLELYQRTLSINALEERFNYTLQPNTSQFLLYPKVTMTFRKRSNTLFSPSGYNLTLNALGASKILLSENNLAEVSADAKAAYMIEPLRLRLYGHALQGYTAIKDINTLPLSLALLLGGTDNLKAYSFNSIGPGRVISYGGLELQKEVVKNIYLVGFYDAGTVSDPSINGVLYDAGGGLMWVSLVGPIKVGVAQPINKQFQRVGGTNPRIVISLGPDL